MTKARNLSLDTFRTVAGFQADFLSKLLTAIDDAGGDMETLLALNNNRAAMDDLIASIEGRDVDSTMAHLHYGTLSRLKESRAMRPSDESNTGFVPRTFYLRHVAPDQLGKDSYAALTVVRLKTYTPTSAQLRHELQVRGLRAATAGEVLHNDPNGDMLNAGEMGVAHGSFCFDDENRRELLCIEQWFAPNPDMRDKVSFCLTSSENTLAPSCAAFYAVVVDRAKFDAYNNR